MSASGIRAGRAFVEVGANSAPLDAALLRMRGKIQSFGRGLAQVGAGLAAAGAGMVASLAWPVKLAADLQTTSTAFETMLGSAEAVKALMGELRAFAATTPFEFTELADASRMLIAFGSGADSVVDELRMLGDVASGVGIPLGELAEIYGKNRVQGRLFAEDVNQLTGRGIPIIAELAKQFGVTESEVRGLVEGGQVGFQNLRQAMESLTTTGMFAGGMERQSKTLVGLWSTLKDSIKEALLPIGEMMVPILSSALQQTSAWVGVLGEVVQGFAFVTAELVGIDAAWGATTAAMRKEWHGVVDFILDNWNAASNGIAAAGFQAAGFLRAAWQRVMTWMGGMIDYLQTKLKTMTFTLIGLMKRDPDTARRLNEREKKAYEQRQARRTAQGGLNVAEIESETADFLKVLADMAEEERAARLAARGTRESAAEAARKAAQARLADWKQAQGLKVGAGQGGSLPTAAAEARKQTEAISGTFNATMSAQQIGIKTSSERTAKATEKIVQLTEKMVRSLAASGGILVGS